MFFYFVAFIYSAIFGIDYGNEFIKTSMALSGKSIHIALNAQSKRLSPSFFSFFLTENPKNTTVNNDGHWTKDELVNYTWLFFEPAKAHALRFPQNSIKGLSPMLEKIHGFDRREALAITLRHLIKGIDDGKWKPEAAKIVFAVEPLMRHEERKAILEAIKIMNGTLTHIIDYPTAAAQLYALEKRSLYLRKERIVAFIDVGATNSWASIFKFENTPRKPTITEISLVTKANLGGSNVDRTIADFVMKKYAEQFSVPVPTDIKVVNRFIDASRKAKELLSLNKEVDIRLEDIEQGRTFSYSLSIQEFQELIKDFAINVSELYKQLIQKSGMDYSDIDSVELIGGSTRIPYVQEVLLNTSKLGKLDRTMNSEEAIALGAGYVGATESTLFVIKKLIMKAFSNTNVFLAHGDKKIQLFNESSYLIDSYRYDCLASDNGNFTILAGNPPTEVSTFTLNLTNTTKPNAKIMFEFGFDEYTIPVVKNVKLNGFRFNISKVIYYPTEHEFNPVQFNESFDFVHEFDKIDASRKEFQEAFDNYESYIFTIKDKVKYVPEFQIVLNETEGDYLISVAEEHRKWLDEHAGHLTLDEIKEQHEKLKKVLSEPERREEHYLKINQTFEDFNKTLNRMYKEITEVWPKKKKWMPKDKIKSSWESYNHSLEYLNNEIDAAIGRKPCESPHAWYNQINIQRQIAEFNFNRTCEMKKPTPTPKPNITETTNETKEETKEENKEEEERNKKANEKLRLEREAHQKEFAKHMSEFKEFYGKCMEPHDDYPQEVKDEIGRLCEDYRKVHFKYFDEHEKYMRDTELDRPRPPRPPRPPRREEYSDEQYSDEEENQENEEGIIDEPPIPEDILKDLKEKGVEPPKRSNRPPKKNHLRHHHHHHHHHDFEDEDEELTQTPPKIPDSPPELPTKDTIIKPKPTETPNANENNTKTEENKQEEL